MSQPELRAELTDDRVDAGEPGFAMPEHDRFLMRHFTAMAAMLIGHPDGYRELYERRRSEGDSDDLRAEAHDAAEQIATVMQSARSRPDLLAAAQSTQLNPSSALLALDQLFFSYALLSALDDELTAAALEPDELDATLASLDVQTWIAALGVAD